MTYLWEAPRGRFGALWDGGGGGGQNTQVSTTSSAPWAAQQPYLQTGFETAKGLLAGGGPQPYPNATYVPMSDPTGRSLDIGQAAAGNMWDANANSNLQNLTPEAINQTYANARGDYWQAAQNNPLYKAGQTGTEATMRGDFVNAGNPQFQQMLTNAMQQAQPGIDASFAGGGRGISGARDASLANAWTNTAGNLAYQNYAPERAMQNAAINASTQMGFGREGAERQNMIGAAAAAPGMTQAGLDPLKQLGQIGAAREGYAGQELQDAMKRWDTTQNAPWANLGKYMSTVGGGQYGNTSTSMVPTTSNPWLTGLGAAGAGANILRTLSDLWKK